MRRILSAVVHPWVCDVMGHMNTRHYVAMFDDANYILLSELDSGVEHGNASLGWADAANEIEYLKEVRAGSVVHLEGAIRKVGTKSLTIVMEMRASSSELACARMYATIVRFHRSARRAVPLDESIRQAARSWLDDSADGVSSRVDRAETL